MGPRPAHLRLNDDDNDLPRPPKMGFHMDLPSPRTGEVPPALSPLDAFALQSRMLAKQFEQEQQNGRRLSRLPPIMVQKELASRPDFFRSFSGGIDDATRDIPSVQEESPVSPPQGLTVHSQSYDKDRPISHYPMLGHASKLSRSSPTRTPYYDAEESQPSAQPDYFGIPRAASPEAFDAKLNVEAPSPMIPSLTSSVDSVQSQGPRTWTNGSTASQRSLRSEHGLLAPRSPAFPKSPRSMQSIRSVPPDSGDEDASSWGGAYATSSSRKFSGSSGMSRPHSPISSYPPPHIHRTPSMTSDYSTQQAQPRSQQAKPYNFSRPRSTQSISSIHQHPSFDSKNSLRTSLEHPHRHASEASNSTQATTLSTAPSAHQRQPSQDDAQTPYIPEKTVTPENGSTVDYFNSNSGATSYTYAKYALPRGRAVDRNSIGLTESWGQHQWTWDENKSIAKDTAPASAPVPAPAKVVPVHPRDTSDASYPSPPARPDPPVCPPSPARSERISGNRLSRRDLSTSSLPRSRSAHPETNFERSPLHQATPSILTSSTDKTPSRPTPPLHQRSPSAELTPDEHLEIGIQAHSAGHLNKSTYHLRLAANAGLPTAMLLYALACRHGWGTRPNQSEGVKWLRLAIDSAGLEISEVETTISHASARSPKADPIAEAAERKKRKAQFALAIYELGISYMNGWGCPKDKGLAVRCYEVAGSWGDADALAEAGFCYTQGQGCRKDLKRAAGLYRRAAEMGMSMAGNSWIYKSKYMDDSAATAAKNGSSSSPVKLRLDARSETPDTMQTRSRGRSIWSRRKNKDKV
ncbi:hypothetical protein LTR78_004501 [Recurvomyces mirabilis]|uniref:Uncharacterized protein n=1 Tax=Recurvomyces mirabilis TaxID=574656 RepID=A0AAE0WQ83_9PEZI|nr:hypothetical protein LTR78_004501 [Recurvomyces mirabilis]